MAVLIFKPTEQCNSNCLYCDVVRKHQAVKTMSLSLLGTLFNRINAFLEERPEEEMEVIWHGGEPLLLGPGYFQAAFEFQERFCQRTKSRISHSIQSNLTLFDESFVTVLKQLGIDQIGSSYEPLPNVRGPGSPIDSRTYNEKFMEGDRLADEHGLGSGIIYVVTRKALSRPLDIFYFLTNFKKGVNLNPVLLYGDDNNGLKITPNEFVEFLGAIFPVWWEHRERYPDVEPFHSLIKTIRDKKTSLGCVDSGSCAYHHLDVGPDGSVSHCGRSADWGILPYGHIETRTISEILRDPQRDMMVKRNSLLQQGECHGCRFWKLCHGGCPLDSWSQHGDFMHKSEWCEAKWRFIEEFFEPVTGLRYDPEEAVQHD